MRYATRKLKTTAARMIQRSYKNYKMNRRLTGSRTSTKQHGRNLFATSLTQRTLWFRLIEFGQQDSSDVNTRLTPNVRLSGFKCCDEFSNNNGYPIEMHYAIVQLKENVEPADIDRALLSRDFFRNPTSSVERATDFETPSGIHSWDINYKCLNLNPDKFNILTHKRKILDSKTPNGGTISTSNPINNTKESSWYWKLHRWYPVKKKHSFDKPTHVIPQRPYVVMYWWQAINRSDHNANAPGDSAVSLETQDVVYYRMGT